jgi:hypothetical protein
LHSGNVHEKGVVAITCSSNNRNRCWDVVNYDWNDYWFTHGHPNNWIQFDFKDLGVSLSHYSLKSDGYGWDHLVQWELSGSGDGNTWVVLDRKQTNDLNGNYITKTYSCNAVQSSGDFYRFIRLQQTGKTHPDPTI